MTQAKTIRSIIRSSSNTKLKSIDSNLSKTLSEVFLEEPDRDILKSTRSSVLKNNRSSVFTEASFINRNYKMQIQIGDSNAKFMGQTKYMDDF